MAEKSTASRPQTAQGTTDWEKVFEDPKAGLIPLIAGARSASALRQATIVVVEQLYARRDDPGEVERFKDEINRMITDDTSEADLPSIIDAVTAILRQVKDDRIAKSAEQDESAAAKGDERRRPDIPGPKPEAKRKPPPKRPGKEVPRAWLFGGGGLGAAGIALAVYFFVIAPDGGDDLTPSLRLIEQVKDAAEGMVVETHVYGGPLEVGDNEGRPFVRVDAIPDNACSSAAWVFLNRGTVVINGVLPNRTSPRILTKLCASDPNGATLVWFPKPGWTRKK